MTELFNKAIRLCLIILFFFVCNVSIRAFAAEKPGYLADYDYQVTDVATKGLTARGLYNQLPTSWMDLKHSVCSNRSLVWGYDLKRKHSLKTGTIFVFFTAGIWDPREKGYMYHAGTYVVENGKELVLEKSYAGEESSSKPLTVVEWMDNEMEGRADANKCVELTKLDTDMTEYFYENYNLPARRAGGRKSGPCYFRKVPGYVAYPADVAEMDLENADYNSYDMDQLFPACVDAYMGKNPFKKPAAKRFCSDYLNY